MHQLFTVQFVLIHEPDVFQLSIVREEALEFIIITSSCCCSRFSCSHSMNIQSMRSQTTYPIDKELDH